MLKCSVCLLITSLSEAEWKTPILSHYLHGMEVKIQMLPQIQVTFVDLPRTTFQNVFFFFFQSEMKIFYIIQKGIWKGYILVS